MFVNAVAGTARTPGNACLSSWTTGKHDDGETIALTVAVRACGDRGYRDEGWGVDADRDAVRAGAELLLGLGATR